jgi:hypothetical protein
MFPWFLFLPLSATSREDVLWSLLAQPSQTTEVLAFVVKTKSEGCYSKHNFNHSTPSAQAIVKTPFIDPLGCLPEINYHYILIEMEGRISTLGLFLSFHAACGVKRKQSSSFSRSLLSSLTRLHLKTFLGHLFPQIYVECYCAAA